MVPDSGSCAGAGDGWVVTATKAMATPVPRAIANLFTRRSLDALLNLVD
jgi:hypothetical protein